MDQSRDLEQGPKKQDFKQTFAKPIVLSCSPRSIFVLIVLAFFALFVAAKLSPPCVPQSRPSWQPNEQGSQNQARNMDPFLVLVFVLIFSCLAAFFGDLGPSFKAL